MSENNSFTPGKWYWDFDRDGLASLRSNAGDGEAIIIDVECCPEVADRCLIAAAPDLLNSAVAALEEMRHTTAPRNSFTDAVDALDAAIAKARGK